MGKVSPRNDTFMIDARTYVYVAQGFHSNIQLGPIHVGTLVVKGLNVKLIDVKCMIY